MHLSSNSSVQLTRLHDGSQLVVILRRVSSGEPAEGVGDEFVLEYDCEPCREEDECGESGHPNGRVEKE